MILAEPVGSCTDLVATVVQPLKDLYGDRFEVAPYPVLFKPSHGLRILKSEPSAASRPRPRTFSESSSKRPTPSSSTALTNSIPPP